MEAMVKSVVVALVNRAFVDETRDVAVRVVPVAVVKNIFVEEVYGALIVPVAEMEARTVLVEFLASKIFPVCVEVTWTIKATCELEELYKCSKPAGVVVVIPTL